MNSVYLEKTVGGEVSLSDAGRKIAEALDDLFRAEHEQFGRESSKLLSQVIVIRIVLAVVILGLMIWTFEGAAGTAQLLGGGLIAFVALMAFLLMDWIGRLRLAKFCICHCQQIRPDINRILTAHPTFRVAVRQVPNYEHIAKLIDYTLSDESAIRESVLSCPGVAIVDYHCKRLSSVNAD